MSDDNNDLMIYRGMHFYEDEAVASATEIALRETREFWLPVLEDWLAKIGDEDMDDLITRMMLTDEIRRLRRLLGIAPDADVRRAATRERVRQHRERKRQGVVLRPRRAPAPPVTRESIAEDGRRQAEVWREIERVKRQAKV